MGVILGLMKLGFGVLVVMFTIILAFAGAVALAQFVGAL